MLELPNDSGLIARPWPGGGESCWTKTSKSSRSADQGPGAGPWKKTPEVIPRIEAIMKHETAGDPMSALKWTRRTTAKIAAELQSLGIQVSDRTVAGLLKQMGFSLRVNHKKLSGSSHPDRDAQFSQIAKLRERCAARCLPVISVDTKKKELVGAFKNQGAKWDREPVLVNDHDFRSSADALAVPYGVYDLQANRGTLFVGTSYDTPEFAVDCVENWWRIEGRMRYPDADRLPSWPTVAVAMVRTAALGRADSNVAYAIATDLPSPSRITLPGRRSGIRLSTAYSANSAKTGQATHWIVSRPSSSTLARPQPARVCVFVPG